MTELRRRGVGQGLPDHEPGPEPDKLLVVDNSDERWKVSQYLREWCDVARALDVATGYFDIGALLDLDGQWQKLDRIRILMGDQVSLRTRQAFEERLRWIAGELDASIERMKEGNDFLAGVPGIVAALADGRIACRVYRERKFHAKAYITHARSRVMGSTALVGSSNLTHAGINENVELNVQLRTEVDQLQQWYEMYWQQAEDVTPEILRVVRRHLQEFTPFEVYAKALSELLGNEAQTTGEWERSGSSVYPVLDAYQRDGYRALVHIAETYGGALLCDSVGLGKTFIGLMLIERLLHERRRVALLVPKAARKPVWETKLQEYLPGAGGIYSNLVIYNHTDLLREGRYQEAMEQIRAQADAVIIDEAHHFRNKGTRQYRKLFDMLEGKTLYLLTATPVNNSMLDLQHMIELFSRRDPRHFARMGINSLPGHFRSIENAVKRLIGESVEVSAPEAERVLANDRLFQALVVQRSRAYVRRSQGLAGGDKVIFPVREPPQVVNYSLAATYGPLLEHLEAAFSKAQPLLSLAVYYPLAYFRGKELDTWQEGRQKQVVGLIRTQLLKRFESSARAFEASCEQLLLKLLAFIAAQAQTPAERARLERWQQDHQEVLARVSAHQQESDEDLEDDLGISELQAEMVTLPREQFDVAQIIDETYADLQQLVVFLRDLAGLTREQDHKLQALLRLLRADPLLARHKVLVFSEYMTTARYLYEALADAGIGPLDEVDSTSKGDRGSIITAFSPYYNGSSSEALARRGRQETRVLISTDVLSEGLNLQDATLLVNYDLHWNPVRLMQRIGRVDRRLDPKVEERMLADHPEYASVRRTVRFWNFLPPGELERLLSLYQRVAHKTLRISKTFGIEGAQLLRPEDHYEALRVFMQQYEGEESPLETMRLRYEEMLAADPGLEERLAAMPLRVFSGHAHPRKGAHAIFFCYALPGPDPTGQTWGEEWGETRWYLLDPASGAITSDVPAIDQLIHCDASTPRRLQLPADTLVSARKQVERYIHNTELRARQAPAGVRPVLKAWMELN